MSIEIKAEPMADGRILVGWTFPNGYRDARPCDNEDIAVAFANGLQAGLNGAKQAIGFVPSPNFAALSKAPESGK